MTIFTRDLFIRPCKLCLRELVFARTYPKSTWMPFDRSAFIQSNKRMLAGRQIADAPIAASHFNTCLYRDRFTLPKKARAPEPGLFE